jgi:hypothetical protein
MNARSPDYGVRLLGMAGAEGSDRATIRGKQAIYADPAAWVVLAAIDRAISSCEWGLAADRTNLGIIVSSVDGTIETVARLVQDTANGGRMSPLRFAGAGPWSLAGLPCIMLGLGGPSLVLTTSMSDAQEVLSNLVTSWLDRQRVEAVVLAVHSKNADKHCSSCGIIGRGTDRISDCIRCIAECMTGMEY